MLLRAWEPRRRRLLAGTPRLGKHEPLILGGACVARMFLCQAFSWVKGYGWYPADWVRADGLFVFCTEGGWGVMLDFLRLCSAATRPRCRSAAVPRPTSVAWPTSTFACAGAQEEWAVLSVHVSRLPL